MNEAYEGRAETRCCWSQLTWQLAYLQQSDCGLTLNLAHAHNALLDIQKLSKHTFLYV